MSSHHVIRENQEPALLIQDFHALDSESLGQLLEWSPTLVTDSDNVDCLLSEGIKVDVLFAKTDILTLQEHTKVFPLDTDFIKYGLEYLIANNHGAVNVLSNYIPSILFDLAKDINIVLFCKHKRYVLVHSYFEKWKPKGDKIYVEEKFLKSFQGLDYKAPGIFETINDGFIHIEFNTSNYVLIGEDL